MISDYKIFDKVSKIFSLGKAKTQALSRLGIEDGVDLLLYKPFGFKEKLVNISLKDLKQGDDVIIRVEIKGIEYPSKSSKQPVKIFAGNDTGGILLSFFKFHNYLKPIFRVGHKLTIAGKIEFYDYKPQISHPEVIFDQNIATKVEPRYALTYGLTNSMLRNYIYKMIPYAKILPEWLPCEILHEYELPSFYDSIRALHNYETIDVLLEKALLRLKIDEATSNQLGFKYLKEQTIALQGRSFKKNTKLKQQIINKLDFELTHDQEKVVAEIEFDQEKPTQMLRMIRGDVGSGKTIVAILTALNVIGNHSQAALMVPTDVLAQQHYNFAKSLLEEFGIKVILLTGKITARNKREALNLIENGEADLVVGTHSLFQENVKFKDLAYIIVDEQHRFGVKQRMELVLKGKQPDVLIMSATPIPRTLSLTMFGDLAVSFIKTRPKSRKLINTFVASINKIDDVCRSIKSKIEKNEKIFWICPLIENQNEEVEKRLPYIDVETRYQYLAGFFGNKVAFLHGAMNGDKKNQLLNSLKEGKINILVATTVIEVGIDIPDATLIVIENSEKFGLAQLHQLRGRVGRGDKESICVLLYGKFTSNDSFNRLKIMRESQDGFYIAEQDLKLRGEGDLLGQKQSGEQNFIFLDIAADAQIINRCHLLSQNIHIDSNKLLQMTIFNKSVVSGKIIG